MNVDLLTAAVLLGVHQVLSQEETCGREGLQMRLLGQNNHFGRVEVSWGNQENGCEWSPVCGVTWDHTKARLTCRQLLFTYDKHQDHEAVWFNRYESEAPCVDIDCSESTLSNLQDCKMAESNHTTNGMIAGVLCDVPPNLPTMSPKPETSQCLIVGVTIGVIATGMAVIALMSILLKGVYHYNVIQQKRLSQRTTICITERDKETPLPPDDALRQDTRITNVPTDSIDGHVVCTTTAHDSSLNYDHLLSTRQEGNEEEVQHAHEYAILEDKHRQRIRP